MQKNRNIFKKLFIGVALCLICALSPLSALEGYRVEADNIITSYFNDVSSSAFRYSNFSTTSSSIVQPSGGWKQISKSSNDIHKDDYKAGVVNLETLINKSTSTELSNFYKTYGLISAPSLTIEGGSESKKQSALMINAPNFKGNMGYETSSNISLDKDSFYRISVSALTFAQKETNEEYVTEQTDPRLSIYLSGFSNSELDSIAKFNQVETNGFNYFTFYIETSSNQSESLSMQLWLGDKDSENFSSMGAVFFSHLEIEKYSKNAFLSHVKEDDNNLHISLSNTTPSNLIKNSNFENNMNGWNIVQNSSLTNSYAGAVSLITNSNYPNENKNKVSFIPGTNFNSDSETSGLLISKYGEGKIEVESDPFEIDRFGLYKISVYAKTDNANTSNISISLVDKTSNSTIDAVSQNISQFNPTSSSNNLYINSWVKYTFTVKGDPNSKKNISIKFSVNGSDGNITYAFFDDVEVEKLNFSTFNSVKTDSNLLNLDTTTSLYLVSNHTFNKVENENENVIYPIKPADWTESSTNPEWSKSGVANKNYIEATVGNTSLNSQPDHNNFLMLDNLSELNKIVFTSKSITLEANSFYYISFNVATSIVNGNVSFRIVTDQTNQSIIYKQDNIISHNEWKKYVAYLKTGEESPSVVVQLISDKAQGEAYFDDIIIKKSTEEVFNAQGNNTVKIDNSFDGFEFINDGDPSSIKQPYSWSATSKNNDFSINEFGIVDSNSNIEVLPNPVEGNGMLYINNSDDSYLFLNRNSAITLSSGNYYRISVWVKTYNIFASDTNNNSNDKLGATFILKYGNETKEFYGIISNDEFSEVVFYINPAESTELNVTLGLGNEEISATGIAFFDKFQVEKLENKEAYDKDLEEVTSSNKLYATAVSEVNVVTNSEDNSNDESKSAVADEVNWLVIPSLITAIAIFVAIIGFVIRKVFGNKKRTTKVKTTYDRKRTLNKDLNKNEQLLAKTALLEDLKEELNQLDEDIKVFNSASASHLRSVKLKYESEIKELNNQIKDLNAQRDAKLSEKNKLISIDKTNVNKEEESKINSEIKLLDKNISKSNAKLNSINNKISRVKLNIETQNDKLDELKQTLISEINKVSLEINEMSEPSSKTRKSKKETKNLPSEEQVSNSTDSEEVANENENNSLEEKIDTEENDEEKLENSQEEDSISKESNSAETSKQDENILKQETKNE